MDFITNLPLVHGYDAVLVMVDWFTKMAHFPPCAKTISTEETTDLFLKNVVRLHGVPDDVTSDCRPQFISCFGRRLLQTLGTIVNMSSSDHSQTDGQTERVKQVLKQYLRCSLSFQEDDWIDLLPLA